ncbi:MAG: Rieske (2Fe-2S) protein [Alphaproteobacteria bacterium]|nr:MAG: Rieske (2Fe-2S) protein [Alphaproteobacteria bacterium]
MQQQQEIQSRVIQGPFGGWQKLWPAEALAGKGRAVFKIAGRQIVVFETESGLYAINNRCPHEGFPLSEGSLKSDCVLACNWHGWTFDLKSGKTLQGRDPVRTYRIERRSDDLWIDITPEPADALKARAYTELEEAMAEHDYERIARSLSRLAKAGEPFEAAAVRVVNNSRDRLEQGLTHAQAGLSDWMALAGDDPELRLGAFLEAFAHFSWDCLFSPKAPVGTEALAFSHAALRGAIEAMDQDRALALVRGAFQAGLGYEDLAPDFLAVLFAHYAGFGHPAIYVMKAERLIARLGPDVEETLALQMARYLCNAAREDLIPEFRQFGDYLAQTAGAGPVPDAAALSGQSVRSVLAMTAGATATPLPLWEQLLAASALNMLRFDLGLQERVEQSIAQNVGWLDFTHALTFAEAVHVHASRNSGYWQSGLLQMACFVGRNAGFLADVDWRAYLVDDREAFFATEKAALFNMDEGDYIFGVHRLKALCATERLLAFVGEETAVLLVAALNRYLHTRQRKRHPARTAFQAHRSVLKEG